MTLEALARRYAEDALSRQERSLSELRSRTGILLGSASLAVSFLGSASFSNAVAPDSGTSLVLVGVVLCAFAAIVLAAVSILVPREKEFVFGPTPKNILDSLSPDPEHTRANDQRLAYDLHRAWTRNDNRLTRLLTTFRVCAISLVVEVLALVLLIVVRMK